MVRNETGKVNRGQDLKIRSRWWVREKLETFSVKNQDIVRLCGSLSQSFNSIQLYMKADIVQK